MTDIPRWQAIHFDGKIYAAFQLPGSGWRYLKKGSEKLTFPTGKAAEDAARDYALKRLFPPMHSTKEPTDKEVADKLGVSDWLKSKRQDVKAATMQYRPGKKPFLKMPGRAA